MLLVINSMLHEQGHDDSLIEAYALSHSILGGRLWVISSLETILNGLLVCYGWQGLAERVKINCFNFNPSINSSLKFLRKTPWTRTKIETLYCDSLKD